MMLTTRKKCLTFLSSVLPNLEKAFASNRLKHMQLKCQGFSFLYSLFNRHQTLKKRDDIVFFSLLKSSLEQVASLQAGVVGLPSYSRTDQQRLALQLSEPDTLLAHPLTNSRPNATILSTRRENDDICIMFFFHAFFGSETKAKGKEEQQLQHYE